MARLPPFEMERWQSLWWHRVRIDLSESGVRPMTIHELLEAAGEDLDLAATALGYPLSEGSEETRANVAAWYEGATPEHVTITNGGSEANLLVLWALLEPGDRLAFMVPNYLQGLGLGPFFADGADPFALVQEAGRWRLDLDALERAVTPRTKVVMVCNPNNPTGSVLSDEEMDAVVAAAERVGAWIVADEIYRGAEIDTDATTPTFWGRAERVVVTSGLSKAFAMPGLRIGWVVADPELIRQVWFRHDYTTLTPGRISDALAAIAMRPEIRETILARTRRIVRENLPIVQTWVAELDVSLGYVRPSAGAIAYLTYDLAESSTELAERIRRDHGVLLVPGDMLGLGRGFRIGFGDDPERLREGLERVGDALRAAS
jgi:hypothetical protein